MYIFVLLGITGSAAIYYSSVILRGSSQISSYVGIAYAAGVFLQFINNNIIKKKSHKNGYNSVGCQPYMAYYIS